MKRIFTIYFFAILASFPSFGWNSIGHASVAKIAEDHISPQIKSELSKYLGSATLESISSDADKFYSDWLRDIGFECRNPRTLRRQYSEKLSGVPSNMEPWCHSYTVDSLFNVYRTNHTGDSLIRNSVMDLDRIVCELKNGVKSMSREDARIRISLLVHLMGDMHCPFHIMYVPKSPTGGAYCYYIGEEKVCPHNLWDHDIWKKLNPDWTYQDFARAADTATPSQIAEVTRGYLYDWGKACARDAFAAHEGAGPGARLDESYCESMRDLLYKQLRNGGYRLAAILDYIFSSEGSEPKANPASEVVFGNVRFTVLTSQLIRMEWSEDGKFEDRASFTFVNRNLEVPAFKLSRSGRGVTIKTDDLVLRYTGGGSRFDASNLSIQFTLSGRKVTWHPGDDDSANLMGTTRTLDQSKGRLIGKGGHLEKGLLSRDGWAIVDDSSRHLFQKNDTHWGEWVESRTDVPRQDWYMFAYGHEYRKALADYSKLSGRAPMPPRYVFGYWWSRYWQYSDSELRDLVDRLHSINIPLDVLIVDMDWHDTWTLTGINPPKDEYGQRIGWTGYTWQKELFPNPGNFLRWTNENNLPVALNLHPASGIQPYESVYEDFVKDFGWTQKGKPVPYMMHDMKWADSYFKVVLGPMEKMGVDFWWLDWQQWMESKYIPGLSNTFWLNHVFYNHARQAQPFLRPFLYHRWGGLGSHRYPLAFSGDAYILWESLEYQPEFTAVSANVNYGYWGHDVGGHMFLDNNKEHTNPEQYTRWMQYGVFTPIYKIHPTKHPNIERYFWLFPDHFFLMKEALERRYSLVPYIYNAARRNYDTGVAMCHPLYYDYPEEDEAYENRTEFLFGDDILGTCISAPADTATRLASKEIWFPGGNDWFDMATGTMYEGGTTHTLSYTIAESPWYVKAGAIIPMNPKGVRSLKKQCDTLVLTFAPGGDGSIEYYEDDGTSQNYENVYALTPVCQKRSSEGLCATISARKGFYRDAPDTRSYELRFPVTTVPAKVLVNGVGLPYERYPREGRECWTYDAYTLAPVIFLSNRSVSRDITVEMSYTPEGVERSAQLYSLPGLFDRCRRISEEYKMKQGINDRYKMLPREYLAVSQCPNFIMENPYGLYEYVDALNENLVKFEAGLEKQTLIDEDFKTVLKAQILGK